MNYFADYCLCHRITSCSYDTAEGVFKYDSVNTLNSRLEVKHVTYTGTTNSIGAIMGAMGDLGMSGGTRCIAAYLQRGSYRVFRKADIGAYGNAGLFVVCSEGASATAMEPISNGDVTIDFYYI